MLFEGTENETRRCPRRLLLDAPELGELMTIRNRHGERLRDHDVGTRYTAAALEAFDAIDSGLAWRLEDEAKQAAKGAKR